MAPALQQIWKINKVIYNQVDQGIKENRGKTPSNPQAPRFAGARIKQRVGLGSSPPSPKWLRAYTIVFWGHEQLSKSSCYNFC